MIVRPFPTGLQLITQPDHAHLARRIMEHCLPLDHHPRREEILLAIGEHDSGWEELEAAPSVDPATGGVADFIKVPVSVRQGAWPRAIARLEGEPWAAALVAHHAWFVYERFRTSADPEWTAFFAEMAAARDARLEALRLSFIELESDYAFLRLGDLISLAFGTSSRTFTEATSISFFRSDSRRVPTQRALRWPDWRISRSRARSRSAAPRPAAKHREPRARSGSPRRRSRE